MNYFDCHADTLTEIVKAEDNLWKNTNDVDLKRVNRFAEKYTQVFAIWKDTGTIRNQCPEEVFGRLYQRAVRLLLAEKEHIVWCKTAADMVTAHAVGKAAAFLAIEDISLMGSYVNQIREMGFRFAMLTWNYENRYACGAAADQEKGLTEEGKQIVGFLLQKNVVLDISHLSDRGAEEIFSMTDRPVIASHSDVREVCSMPRNLKREQIQELIRRKGLIGLNFYAPFLGEAPKAAELLRHIDAVLTLGGEDVLALGGDFDGCSGLFPEGITGVESIPYLRYSLEKEGVDGKILDKIFFENAYQFVLRTVR